MSTEVDRWPNQDIVHAVVLPDLEEEINDFETKKIEFTEQQARRLDLSNLPILVNHDEEMGEVGHTVAYCVRDATPTQGARAEVVFALTNEDTARGGVQEKLQFQRNALMNGAHRDVSLGHVFDVDYVGNTGTHAASVGAPRTNDPYGDPGCVINKNAVEISTCSKGKRKGSHILEYVPCRKSLERAMDATVVRRFCARYKYTEPPPDATVASPVWSNYINHLAGEVEHRRKALLNKQLLSGTYQASANSPGDELLAQMPWIFVAAEKLVPHEPLTSAEDIAMLAVPQNASETQ